MLPRWLQQPGLGQAKAKTWNSVQFSQVEAGILECGPSSPAFPGKVELAPMWMLVVQAAVCGHCTMLALLFCFKCILCFLRAADLYEP